MENGIKTCLFFFKKHDIYYELEVIERSGRRKICILYMCHLYDEMREQQFLYIYIVTHQTFNVYFTFTLEYFTVGSYHKFESPPTSICMLSLSLENRICIRFELGLQKYKGQ